MAIRDSAPKDNTDYAAQMKAAQKKGDKKAYYTAQRKRDEKLVLSGNTKARSELKKIGSKSAGAMKAIRADQEAAAERDPFISGTRKVQSAINAVAPFVLAPEAKAASMIPEAAAFAKRILPAGRRALSGGARAMKNVTPKGVRGGSVSRRAIGSARGQAVGKAHTVSQAARAKSAPKALPKPKGPSPKMQHERVSAGVKRNANVRKQQDTTRNKGTNARASGKNPRAKKKAARAST